MKRILIIASLIPILWSCNEQNEDVVSKPSRDGAIEVKIEATRTENFTIYKTRSDVFIKNKLVKTIIKSDTLPLLGFTKEEGENSEGEVKELLVPKEFEIYLTVK